MVIISIFRPFLKIFPLAFVKGTYNLKFYIVEVADVIHS